MLNSSNLHLCYQPHSVNSGYANPSIEVIVLIKQKTSWAVPMVASMYWDVFGKVFVNLKKEKTFP